MWVCALGEGRASSTTCSDWRHPPGARLGKPARKGEGPGPGGSCCEPSWWYFSRYGPMHMDDSVDGALPCIVSGYSLTLRCTVSRERRLPVVLGGGGTRSRPFPKEPLGKSGRCRVPFPGQNQISYHTAKDRGRRIGQSCPYSLDLVGVMRTGRTE